MTMHDISQAKEIADWVGIMVSGDLVEKLYVEYVSQIAHAAITSETDSYALSFRLRGGDRLTKG